MLRYLRLYLCFVRFSFSRAMEFRVDFFFRVVMDSVFYAVNIGFFSILYRHTASVAGWSYDQALVFVTGFFFVDALHMTVFSNNLWWLPFSINHGDLDYYLVRPVSSLFFMSLRDFAANSFLNLILAAGLLAWSVARYPEPLGTAEIALFVALLVCGCILYWTIYMCFMIPVFWIQSETGLRQLFYGFVKFAERPDAIFRGWLHRVLTTGLPFALIASYPARILFDGATLVNVCHVTGVLAAFFALMVWFWRRGLRAYSSASS